MVALILCNFAKNCYTETMKDRILRLLKEMAKGIYEKDTELAMSLLAAIAGESLLHLGPPGVAKSMVARRVKAAFHEGKSFEYLMSRFSTPDEIFGPVSISKLKDSDKYERSIDGYLPMADVVFLDEIWKAGKQGIKAVSSGAYCHSNPEGIFNHVFFQQFVVKAVSIFV